MSRATREESKLATSLEALVGHAAFPWWWHTIHDTIDKVAPDVLLKDTRVAALVVCYFCLNTILPVDYVAGAQEILDLLLDLEEESGGKFPLAGTIEKAKAFLDITTDFHRVISGKILRDSAISDAINQAFIDLGHIIIPMVQTGGSPFDHDPALPMKRLPGLHPVADLNVQHETSDTAGFLRTRLTRERNRIDHAFFKATNIVKDALEKIQSA
jgi:hypothetical protein